MGGVRESIDRGLEAWGRAVYRRPRRVIASCFLLAAALASQIPNLVIEATLDKFLHEDDPLRVSYDAFREQFGRDDVTLVAIETADVFSEAALASLRAFHHDLEEEVPHVYEVTSLVNARETRGEGDRLIVGELLEDWPATDAERRDVRERALANRLYRNLLVSEDARIAVVLIEGETFSSGEADPATALAGFDAAASGASASFRKRPFATGDENVASVLAIDEIAARYEREDFRIWVIGTQPMAVFLQRALQRDMATFTLLGVATIALGLALLFRSVVGVLLPLAVVTLSLSATMGLLAVAGFPIGIPTQILPSFLLAVGVGYSVHLLAIFFQHLERGEDKERAILGALRHSGLALALTALTPAGALASFASSPLAPVEALGIAAPGGIALAFGFTITLLPAMVAVMPMRGVSRGPGRGTGLARRLLVGCGRFSVRHPKAVFAVSLAAMAASLGAASRIGFSHDPLSWFPEQSAFRRGMELANERLGGSIFLELLFDTRKENGLHDPDLLHRLDALRRQLEAVGREGLIAGRTLSIVDVVKEVNQALSANRPEAYAIPDDRRLVAQELLLFENSGSDDLEDVTDALFRLGRFTLKTPLVDAHAYPEYLAWVETEARRIVGDRAEVSASGLLVIMARTLGAVAESLVSSYGIAFVVILVLLVALLGDLRLGLLSMLPNVAPIVLTLALMGVAGLPLDVFTLLIGSIAIGLAVDDTIHFMHHFRRYYEETGDVEEAVARTLSTAGQAMLFTTVVLTAGFLIYCLASMNNLFNFGLLTATTISTALLADLTLAPAIVALFARRLPSPSVG